MKLTIQPGNTRRSAALEFLIESRLIALADRQRIEEATVRFTDHQEGSPRYPASIQLRVPGPDLHAVACGRPSPAQAGRRFCRGWSRRTRVLEKFIPVEREFSVLLVRGVDGALTTRPGRCRRTRVWHPLNPSRGEFSFLSVSGQ